MCEPRRRLRIEDPAELARTARIFRKARERRYAAMPEHLRRALAEPVPAKVGRSARFQTLVELCRAAGYDQDTTAATLLPWCERAGKYSGRVAAEVRRSWAKADPAVVARKRDPADGLLGPSSEEVA